MSLYFDEGMTGNSRQALRWRRASHRWRSGVAIAAAAVALAGCTSSDRVPVPAPAAAPPVSAPAPATTAPPCTGADGQTVVKKLFNDLSHGRKIDLRTYFVAPLDFVRWIDPGAYVTFLPADDGSVTLAALQSRLDRLERQHVNIALTEFADGGYAGDALNNDAGGWFSLRIRLRLSAAAQTSDGTGKGAIDCMTKKIMVMVLESR
jgi:hypothetical protein